MTAQHKDEPAPCRQAGDGLVDLFLYIYTFNCLRGIMPIMEVHSVGGEGGLLSLVVPSDMVDAGVDNALLEVSQQRRFNMERLSVDPKTQKHILDDILGRILILNDTVGYVAQWGEVLRKQQFYATLIPTLELIENFLALVSQLFERLKARKRNPLHRRLGD